MCRSIGLGAGDELVEKLVELVREPVNAASDLTPPGVGRIGFRGVYICRTGGVSIALLDAWRGDGIRHT